MKYRKLLFMYSFLICLLHTNNLIEAQNIIWQQTNGPFYGTIIGFASSQSGALFAATTSNVYRSTNNGTNWVRVYSGGTIYSIVSHPSGAIYLGQSSSIYRSTDDGMTWNSFTVQLGLSVYTSCFAIAPTGNLYIGTLGQGVYRTTNNGLNWSQMNLGLLNTFVYSLATGWNGELYAGTDGGVYRSNIFGSGWVLASNGLWNGSIYSLTTNSKGYVFAGMADGAFRTTDQGSTWTEMSGSWINRWTYTLANINPGGSFEYLFAGTNNSDIYRSSDDGTSWAQLSPLSGDVRIIKSDSRGILFAGCDGGVFHSSDNGESWIPINIGLSTLSVNVLAVSPDGYLFAAGSSAGIFRSGDRGERWTKLTNGLPISNFTVRSLVISKSISTAGNIYAGIDQNGVYYSTNNGNVWLPYSIGLKCRYTYGLAINSKGHIFAATDSGVFRCTSGEWTRVNNGITYYDVRCIAINSKDELLTGSGSVYKSFNNGDSWYVSNSGLTSSVYCLASSPLDRSGDNWYAGTYYGIYRSTDDGLNWKQTSKGLSTNTNYYTIAFHPNGTIFTAGNYTTVYSSNDTGNTWTQCSTGLPSNPYIQVVVCDTGGTLFAGSNNSYGIFRSTSLQTGGIRNNHAPQSVFLMQNYPNPFNTSTVIDYQLKNQCHIRLGIYNLLGEKIATLVDDEQIAGMHSVRLDSRQLRDNCSAGVYFYQLETDKIILKKKMILLR